MTRNQEPIHTIHVVDTWLRTTENWLFGLVKHQAHTTRGIASDRQLECMFQLPSVECYRSPLQPRLYEHMDVSFLLRLRRVCTRATYPWYLTRVLRGQSIDIFHSHFAPIGWRFRNVARKLGAAHTVSFYGWDYAQLIHKNPAWKPRLQELYATADRFVCEGPHGASLLAAQGCPQDKICVVPLGVDTEAISFYQRTKPMNTLQLLQVASFREKKGHIDTVHAFADALEYAQNMHLTLVGASPGTVHDAVTKIIRARGIDKYVSLLPGVAFNQLHTTMRDYDVFIHPSCHAPDGDCEGGAPIVLLDAQATGMPIISTAHCDIPEEVINGVTGVLCAEHDTAALTQAIIHFHAMDQPTYDGYARAARSHVERNFDVRECAAKLEAVYAEVLAR